MACAYIFAWHFLPLNTTSTIRIDAFANALSADFDGVFVITRHWNSNDNYLNEYYSDTENSEIKIIQTENYQIIQLPDQGRISLKIARFLRKIKIFQKLYFYIFFIITKKDVANNFFQVFKKSESKFIINLKKEDFVICTGPPFTTLFIGEYLKKKYGIKWAADFRDPWNFGENNLYNNSFSERFRKFYLKSSESKLLESSDLTISVSTEIENSFPERFKGKINLIYNGFDAEIKSELINEFPDKFRIVYAGKIYESQLDNDLFFVALNNFIIQNIIKKSQFELVFIGLENNFQLIEMLKKHNLFNFSILTPWLNKLDTYSIMYEASCFLFLPFTSQSELISSKQYTYLAMRKPILVPIEEAVKPEINSRNFEAWKLLNSENKISIELNKLYFNYLNKKSAQLINVDLDSISMKYSAEELRKIISEIRNGK